MLTTAAAIAGAFATASALMVYQAFTLKLVRIRLECPDLPPAFQGFRILQLSDLHMTQMGVRERAMNRLSRGLRPDIVALTGDLAADEVAARDLARVARDAEPRLGTFAISGNADLRYPQAWSGVKRVLQQEGVQILENEHRLLQRDGQTVILAGVDDPHTGQDDLHKALHSTPPGGFIILLAHSPVIMTAAIEKGADVILSGHTHGGQLVVPGVGPLLTRSGYGKRLSSGHFKGDRLRKIIGTDPGNTQIYISRGIGASFLPIRLFCSPEITLFELV